MDFIDEVKQFSRKCQGLVDKLTSEEATKHALVLPFLQLMGYNVFDPTEVVPEFSADVGTKKGEKVDYAIMIGGEPAILIEAKPYGDDLSTHDTQLYRYFSVTKAKFAILTNGALYKFYSDLQETNKLDSTPFLEFNMLDPKDHLVPELKRFHRESFNADEVFSAATNLRYTTAIKQLLDAQLKDPDDEFLRFILKDTYPGHITQKILAQFRPVVKRAITQYINDLINDRLSSALQTTESSEQASPAQETDASTSIEAQEERPRVVTTEEELEAYHIVKSMLRREFDPSRISHKDTQSYFSVLLDGNTWRWICRFRFDGPQKVVILHRSDGREKRKIDCLDDLYCMEEELLQIAKAVSAGKGEAEEE